MTTPPSWNDPAQSDPNQPADGGQPPAGYYPPPAGQPAPYQPQSGAYVPPSGAYQTPGAAYQPPAGAYPPPGSAPGVSQPGFPPPGFPGAPGTPPPPPAGSGRRKAVLVRLVSVLVVVAVGIGFAIWKSNANKSDTAKAQVGTCIEVKNSTTVGNADTAPIDCSSPNASYIITETGDSNTTCDENEAEYYEGASKSNVKSRVCLRPNLKVGDCFDFGMTSVNIGKKVDCSAATTTSGKLAALLTDTSDESKCPADSKGVAFTKRNLVYCFTPVE